MTYIWCRYCKKSNPIKSINKTNHDNRKYISLGKMLRSSIIKEAEFEVRPTCEARPKLCLGANLEANIWTMSTLRPGQAYGARPGQARPVL